MREDKARGQVVDASEQKPDWKASEVVRRETDDSSHGLFVWYETTIDGEEIGPEGMY